MNTHEEYVTYAQGQTLKELRFDWPCRYYATKRDAPEDHYWNCIPESPICNSMMLDCEFAVPTQALACRWLREEKGLFIDVWLCAAGWSWNIEKCGSLECNGTHVTKHDEESGDDEDSGLFTTYESALSAGIDRALELLKGGEV